MCLIRHLEPSDADAIALILAEGWRQAYSAFMPERLLAPRIDVERRKAEIAEWLATDFDVATETILVAVEDGVVTGFVNVVVGDKDGLGAAGFVNLIYVLPDRQGHGQGRALMAAAAEWLGKRATGPLALSAYEQNPWRSFYDRLGGQPVRRKTVDLDGHALQTILYVWPNPAVLTHIGRSGVPR
jgi:GNAT superfamily N-acetyltransferase